MRRIAIRFGLTGLAGAALLALLLLAPVGGGSSVHAGGGPCGPPAPVPIPVGGTATVDCLIADPGAIKDLNVLVVINHTYTSDLNISLTHVDSGTSTSLIFKECSSSVNINALLDDEATVPVGDVCPISGVFIPSGPLSVFDGESFAGTWTLTVTDQFGIEPDGSIKALRLDANTNHGIKKDPNLANLWLCSQGTELCDNEDSGVEQAEFEVSLNEQVIGESKGEPQAIGSFEFEVRYNAKYVTVEVLPGDLFTVDVGEEEEFREGVSCQTIEGEGFVQFSCVTKGKPEDAPVGPGELAEVVVRATADVYSILIANQENGIATQLINQDCNLSDLQGHPITLVGELCQDAAVTIRYLEGDIRADCIVDVLDQQLIAFRWGSRLGNLLFNSRYDLEPSAPKKGDGDIDAKDLQFVYGRHGSTCKDPHPAQDPVDPKEKPELPGA